VWNLAPFTLWCIIYNPVWTQLTLGSKLSTTELNDCKTKKVFGHIFCQREVYVLPLSVADNGCNINCVISLSLFSLISFRFTYLSSRRAVLEFWNLSSNKIIRTHMHWKFPIRGQLQMQFEQIEIMFRFVNCHIKFSENIRLKIHVDYLNKLKFEKNN
jgi:hypothetical protein